jgi:hypothetical protein
MLGAEIAAKSVPSAAFEAPGPALDIKTVSRQELEREKLLLSTALQEEERELGRSDFWYFLTQVLYPDTWQSQYTERFHRPITEALQNLEPGADLWIFLQRQARKSFISTIAHAIWRIIRDPNVRYLLVGAREETVKPFARVIKSAFEAGTPGFEKFQALYPEFITQGRGKTLKQAFQFTVPNRTVNLPDPTFRAAYLGVTGAGWRCDLLDFDDCVERRNVATAEGSAKALMQMSDLLPLLDKTSTLRNIVGKGTRWSFHDPYGKIIGEEEEQENAQEAMERFKARNIKVIMRHSYEDPQIKCTHCPAHIVAQWPHGHPVPPENPDGVATCFPIHTQESLLGDLERYRTNPTLGESLWWHQYQNVCLAPSSQKFKAEWFQLTLNRPSWPVSKKRILAVDSADKDFQKKGLGDWMVALFAEFDDVGRVCLRYALRSNKWTREEFLTRIVTWCQGTAWWPALVAKEKFGEDTFLTDAARVFRNHFHPTHCTTVQRPTQAGTTMKKFDWIVEALQGPMERGEVVFGSMFPPELRSRMEYEGTNLGQTSHEDMMDTLSLLFAPGVRIVAPNRAISVQSAMTPPPLDLYDPMAPPRGPMPGPPQDPLKNRGTEILVDSLGFSQITWNPATGPQRLDIRFDG